MRPKNPADVFVIPLEMEALMREAPPAPEITGEENKVRRRLLGTQKKEEDTPDEP